MRSVKEIYHGNRPASLKLGEGEDRIEIPDPYHALSAVIEFETMQVFGGYWDMLRAPRHIVARVRLIMEGKGEYLKETMPKAD